MFHTPILLITFNRPDHVSRVLSEIREQRPQEFFIAQDGPREGNERDKEKLHEVRKVIKELVDWPCNLHTLYQETNLGCGPGPAAAISWFFENVEMGIIIEDDAVPHQDFFPYCEELLERYKDDKDVRAIGSMNVDTRKWGEGSYYFSMMNRNLCAWATWKRVWMDFDLYLSNVSRRQLAKALSKYGCGAIEREYWLDRLREIEKDCCGGKSWDMQFVMAIWLSHGKGIIPNVNLCSNIGCGIDATHPMEGSIIDDIPVHPILPLRHPYGNDIQSPADREFFYRYFEPGKKDWNWFLSMYNIINRRVKRFVGHNGPWIKKS